MPVLLWNGDAYPAPRTERKGTPPGAVQPGDPAAAALASLPQIELINYKLSLQVANRRTREVSRAMVGPAVIDVASMYFNMGEEANECWFTIAVTATPEDELDAADSATFPATAGITVLTLDLRNTVGFTADPDVPAFMGFVPGMTTGPVSTVLRKPVLLPEFYLSFELLSTVVTRKSASGTVRVITALTPDLLLSFL